MMLEASIAPSAEPAPTKVCSSSMKRITVLSLRISSITALMRSSNWPRYFVPATIKARSKVMTFLSRKISGTLPEAISCANPSTRAVFPTPASPISTGLFLVRRQRIWTTRSISFFRPMTGSISPLRASSVKSRPKAFRAGVLTSLRAAVPAEGEDSELPVAPSSTPPAGSAPSSKLGSSSLSTSCRARSISTSRDFRTRAATPSPSRKSPRRMCSVPT